MTFFSSFLRRQPLSPAVSCVLLRGVPAAVRRLHGPVRLRQGGGDKGQWSRGRAPEQPPHPQPSPLNRATALMLRKSAEKGFLSWFGNGLLATGIGVIVQSQVGPEAGDGFFLLGGVCVVFGGASTVSRLFALKRLMLLSGPGLLLQTSAVATVSLLWLCAVSLCTGRLEVEVLYEMDEECTECRDRREQRGHGRRTETEDRDK